ncbi:hypothetical protein ACFV9W_07635 [Streptomyces sp. NPDC059897]|uniref:hypothetical protein n=1 Tax=Streptomyces sp. NPDC059897 TaxID=3346994 RepID=UPI00365EC951
MTGLRTALRVLAYAALVCELVVTGFLLAGTRPPRAVEAAVVAVLVVEACGLAVLYRRGGRDAVREVVPAKVRRMVGHELRVFTSLLRWAARRPHGVPAGADAFPYARGQAVMMYGITFVCVVESFGMWALLRDWPTLHHVVLFLDVYTVVWILGLHAAAVTRPHVLSDGILRVRRGILVDLRIPLERITAVRRENKYTHEAKEGELNLDIGAQTSITIELAEPVRHFTFLGRPRDVRLVRLHAEDPDALARTLELTRARTAPSPTPGPPA